MLMGKHFGRSHNAALIAVAFGEQAAEHGDKSLARAYISLKKPVHLFAAHQIGADLLDDPLLGGSQTVGEGLVASVEILPDTGHQKAF